MLLRGLSGGLSVRGAPKCLGPVERAERTRNVYFAGGVPCDRQSWSGRPPDCR
jgi:hypothetical protein